MTISRFAEQGTFLGNVTVLLGNSLDVVESNGEASTDRAIGFCCLVLVKADSMRTAARMILDAALEMPGCDAGAHIDEISVERTLITDVNLPAESAAEIQQKTEELHEGVLWTSGQALFGPEETRRHPWWMFWRS